MSDEFPPRNAREAAEALFKPKQPPQAAEDPAAPTDPSAPPSPPPRAPRILMVPQPQPVAAPDPEPEPALARKPRTRRLGAPKERAGAIPRSEHGRIRVLTTYGMTIQQVAEAYGVAEGEIERIITKPGAAG